MECQHMETNFMFTWKLLFNCCYNDPNQRNLESGAFTLSDS
jgi:hypothetical protein